MNPAVAETGRKQTPQVRTHSHRWLLVLRVLWLSTVLLIVGILAAAVPSQFKLLSTVCVGEPGRCASEKITTDGADTLAAVGLSLEAYAVYNIVLDASITLVALVIGLLIFWPPVG